MSHTAIGGGPRPRLSLRRRRALTGWLFMVPLFAVTGFVVVSPAVQAVYYSFTDWTGLGAAEFVGLANYRELLHDPDFHQAFINTLIWTAITLVVPMALGLTGAFLLARLRRGQVLLRLVFFVPFTVATVISAAAWRYLLSPTQGLGEVLGVNFLGSREWALPTVALISSWAYWGFLVVVFLGAMQSVNPALYEAASLDGASALRQFIHVTIPSIRPTLAFMVMQTLIWSFLAFDFVYILTKGGPAGSTEVLSTYLYGQAFEHLRAGYAAAIGVVLAGITLVIVLAYQLLRRLRGWES